MEKSKEIYLFHQGTYYHAYNLLGCHTEDGGAWFRCWAPNAKSISVVGDFNGWDENANKMSKLEDTGIWEVFVSSVKQYDNYKYQILTAEDKKVFKADPYAFHSETNGATASKVYEFQNFEWTDKKYFEKKANENHYEKPMNIYEVNFASWKRKEDGSYLSYKEIADELIPYLIEMGYNFIETMPLTEYPYEDSWGYQATGYFSVTSRFGTPEEFRYFVNKCHENGIGVILDWVPAHFPKDSHGLVEWDGSYLYENQGWDRMEHKSWGTRVFDYGRNEVQSFLISSATFFIDKYHIDGLRVDAVSSMLYLDYDKEPGEWIPNVNGDNKNLEAIAFLQKLNSVVLTEYPNAIMIAEESTSWPMVTKPHYIGGLGFNYKWNMGWMNDTLSYVSIDPFFRKDNHNKLTFSMFYAFSENFILPISHDEVVYGKGSLLNKMFGDYNQKFELMRVFLMYMYAHPGKKLNFMGNEFAQFDEWNNSKGIDFMLLDFKTHKNMQIFTKDLNKLYLNNSELYEIDYSWQGFKWLTSDDKTNNVIAFERRNKKGDSIICVANFSPINHTNYRVGVTEGKYIEILNSNDKKYGGNGIVCGDLESEDVAINGFESSIKINLEPNTAIFFKRKNTSITLSSKFLGDIANEQGMKKPSVTIEAKKIVEKIMEAKKRNETENQEPESQIQNGEEREIPKEVNLSTNKEVMVQGTKEITNLQPKEVAVQGTKEITVKEKNNIVVAENAITPSAESVEQKFENKTQVKEVSKTSAENKRGRGRPRKPIDPEELNKPKRGRGRPRKPIDPEELSKPKRGRGRPRKPIDPEELNKPKRGRGRPKIEK